MSEKLYIYLPYEGLGGKAMHVVSLPAQHWGLGGKGKRWGICWKNENVAPWDLPSSVATVQPASALSFRFHWKVQTRVIWFFSQWKILFTSWVAQREWKAWIEKMAGELSKGSWTEKKRRKEISKLTLKKEKHNNIKNTLGSRQKGWWYSAKPTAFCLRMTLPVILTIAIALLPPYPTLFF